ncbi:hypothetical protein ACFLXA_06815 [Chloroflexota bacterium]
MSTTSVNPSELTLYDSVIAVLGAIHEEPSKMKDDNISIEACYRAFSRLACEFPDDFPGLYFSLQGGVPYSTKLENILFRIGAWGLVRENNPDYLLFTIPKHVKELIRQELIRLHGGETGIKHYQELSLKFKTLLENTQ